MTIEKELKPINIPPQDSWFNFGKGANNHTCHHIHFINEKDTPLLINFCKADLVNLKRQMFIVFKQQYLTKMQHMKSKGQKLNTSGKIDGFIEDNLDQLYENRKYDLCDLDKMVSHKFCNVKQGCKQSKSVRMRHALMKNC